MHATRTIRLLLVLVVIAMLAIACAADDPAESGEASEEAGDMTEAATTSGLAGASEEAGGTLGATDDGPGGDDALADTATEGVNVGDAPEADTASAQACDADAIMEAIESGPEEGTTAGMAEAPVATAAASNPVLTTLATAIEAAGLVDSLNEAEAVTVFAPTDCAFSNLDPATMDAAMADPSGMLTQVLGYHVIPDQQVAADDLSGDYETFVGELIDVDGTTVAGQAEIIVPDVETANGTVHLIDAVLMPASIAEGQGATSSEPPVADDDAGADVDSGEPDEGAAEPTEGDPQGAAGAADEEEGDS